MTEEYKEVTDYKKIGLIIGLAICVGIAVWYFRWYEFPDITLPEVQNNEVILTEKQNRIRPEYQKFIELGISVDDVIDFQEMPCETFNTPEMISTNPKYTAIIEQRRSDCF